MQKQILEQINQKRNSILNPHFACKLTFLLNTLKIKERAYIAQKDKIKKEETEKHREKNTYKT